MPQLRREKQPQPGAARLVVRCNDKVRVGRAVVVDVVDAGNLSRLVDAQPLRGVQRPEQRQAARGHGAAVTMTCMMLCR
jgi:precorrin-6B methylase 2